MKPEISETTAEAVLALRVRYRQEMNCQIVKDSIHSRPGWTITYALRLNDTVVGFATVAIAGPWKGKPTLLEFYLLGEHRNRAFDLFEAFLAASGVRLLEIQSNDPLLPIVLHAYARDIWSESIVFRDGGDTGLRADGAVFQCLTSDNEIRASICERAGQAECSVVVAGDTVATGSILFHYNAPFVDLAMDVPEPFRRRGFGSYCVQQLKRLSYDLGSVPCARCNPNNIASRKTLQKAGLVPFAHILNGTIPG